MSDNLELSLWWMLIHQSSLNLREEVYVATLQELADKGGDPSIVLQGYDHVYEHPEFRYQWNKIVKEKSQQMIYRSACFQGAD